MLLYIQLKRGMTADALNLVGGPISLADRTRCPPPEDGRGEGEDAGVFQVNATGCPLPQTSKPIGRSPF
jgi:hypothetical protein